MKKNILVGQSGGPTAVINASLYGVIQEGLSHPDEIGAVYGMINGIEGFLSGHTINLSAELSKEDLELLRLTPAAYLGSCRYKLPENMDASVYPLLFEKFKAMNIGANTTNKYPEASRNGRFFLLHIISNLWFYFCSISPNLRYQNF